MARQAQNIVAGQQIEKNNLAAFAGDRHTHSVGRKNYGGAVVAMNLEHAEFRSRSCLRDSNGFVIFGFGKEAAIGRAQATSHVVRLFYKAVKLVRREVPAI